MTLSGSENKRAHTLNHVAIQVTIDCFTHREVTYMLVGQILAH